jgi:hypothetical protein
MTVCHRSAHPGHQKRAWPPCAGLYTQSIASGLLAAALVWELAQYTTPLRSIVPLLRAVYVLGAGGTALDACTSVLEGSCSPAAVASDVLQLVSSAALFSWSVVYAMRPTLAGGAEPMPAAAAALTLGLAALARVAAALALVPWRQHPRFVACKADQIVVRLLRTRYVVPPGQPVLGGWDLRADALSAAAVVRIAAAPALPRGQMLESGWAVKQSWRALQQDRRQGVARSSTLEDMVRSPPLQQPACSMGRGCKLAAVIQARHAMDLHITEGNAFAGELDADSCRGGAEPQRLWLRIPRRPPRCLCSRCVGRARHTRAPTHSRTR